MNDLATELRQLGDRLRALADHGLQWADEKPYDRERYEEVRHIAADLFGLADTRSGEEVERTLFTALTHIAPVPVADAAIFDGSDRILLIRRADNGLWAMPGGMLDMDETPAAGAAREAREEAGVEVDVLDLIAVRDSRLCESRSAIQLYVFLFHCRYAGDTPGGASTPHEVLDVAWFSPDALPELSPGHTVRVPQAMDFHRRPRAAWFDPPR